MSRALRPVGAAVISQALGWALFPTAKNPFRATEREGPRTARWVPRPGAQRRRRATLRSAARCGVGSPKSRSMSRVCARAWWPGPKGAMDYLTCVRVFC